MAVGRFMSLGLMRLMTQTPHLPSVTQLSLYLCLHHQQGHPQHPELLPLPPLLLPAGRKLMQMLVQLDLQGRTLQGHLALLPLPRARALDPQLKLPWQVMMPDL